ARRAHDRGRRGRERRGPARTRVGRERRPVHERRPHHHLDAAQAARRALGHRDRARRRLSDDRVTPQRPPGLSVRIKLTLSYAGFLAVAGVALFVVGFLLLRFVPTGAIFVEGGGWAPNRANLLETFVKYASW